MGPTSRQASAQLGSGGQDPVGVSAGGTDNLALSRPSAYPINWSRLRTLNPMNLIPKWSGVAAEDPDPAARRGRSRVPGGGAVAIGVLGTALGLGVTELVVSRGLDPGAVAVGPWMARPQVGTVAIDPYARADLARSGRLPLAANEGLTFTATTDDTGYRLVRNCVYRLSGISPSARLWTLTASGADGNIMDDPAHRSAFTSTDVVRDLDGRFAIAIAPTARPGNWLPVAGEGTLTLSLRLYDTPLAGNANEVAAATLPTITRQACSAAGTTSEAVK